MGFVSDVSRVFVVAVSHGLGPNLAAVRGFRRRYSKARFRDAFEASFVGDMSAPGSVRQGFPCWGQSFPFIHFSFFFIGFVSDVSRVFVVAVSHGLGPNLAAVRGFRRQYSEVETLLRQALWAICRLLEACAKVFLAGANLFLSFFFLMGFVSDVSRVFVVAVSHGLGPNLAAVRGFRRRYSKARFRDAFEASFVGDMSAPGSVRQGFPMSARSVLGPIFSFHFSFFLMGFVSDVSRVFVVAVSHGLGPNLAAFRGFRRRTLL